MYHNPVKVIVTDSWQKSCSNFQNKLNIKDPLIITSEQGVIRYNLSEKFPKNAIFDRVLPNPSFEDCQKAVNFSLKYNFDGVIAIGGGSVLDTAKPMIAAMSNNNGFLSELLSLTKPYENKIKSIFIPTTHGTGSEVTKWGTIWNTKNKKKYSISHDDLYPSIAILDASLTTSLPLDISIITILDALSHSFEAIWNKNANSQSTELAIDAICLILNNINSFKNNYRDVLIRKKMMIASNKAGLAFSNTKTAAAHSISYPLTIDFGIPHGIASSISLIPLLKINNYSIKKPLSEIFNRLDTDFDTLLNQINLIPEGIVPFKLSKWKIKKTDLIPLSEKSFTKGRMDNNIVDLNRNEVLRLLEEIF